MGKELKPKWLSRRVAAPGPHLTLVLSQAEFDSMLRKLRHPPGLPFLRSPSANATTHCLTNDNTNDAVCIVALGDFSGRNAIEIAGLLVHEAVHVWQQYCDSIGEDAPGREQEAYAVQAIAQELMAEFARRTSAE